MKYKQLFQYRFDLQITPSAKRTILSHATTKYFSPRPRIPHFEVELRKPERGAAIFCRQKSKSHFEKLADMPPIYAKYRKPKRSYLVKIDTRKHRMFKRDIPKFAAVVGHSFIKNVKRYVESKMVDRGIFHEVQSGARRLNSSTAEVMDLDILFAGIVLEWAYVFDTEEWKKAMRIVMASRPEILVVNIGSNEICNIIRASPGDDSADVQNVVDLVDSIGKAARGWRDDHGISVIVFMSVLQRTKGYPANFDRFKKLMGRFNDELHRLTDGERGMVYKHVEGFDCWPDGSPLAVEDWAPDGAHPGWRKGDNFESPAFQKFYQEVRSALTQSIPRLCER